MTKEWKSNLIGIFGIVLGLLALINEKDRAFAAIIAVGAVVFYIISSFSQDMDKYNEKITKLEEKLKIHEHLISMKGDIEFLKKEVTKRN